MNNYEKITALVPDGEHFDSSAINEGVYLTEGHVANIEVELKNNAAAIAQHDATVTDLNGKLNTANQQLETSNQQLTAKDTEITALKNEVAELKKKPAADFTQTSKEKDDHGGGEVKEVSEVTRQANAKRKEMGLKEI